MVVEPQSDVQLQHSTAYFAGPKLSVGDSLSGLPANDVHAVTAGDLNGDRRLDIATANHDSDDVSVFFGKGNGQFQPPRILQDSEAAGPHSILAAELRGDEAGFDLIVGNAIDHSLSIFYNVDKTGLFAGKPEHVVLDGSPEMVAMADFDGDMDPDIAVVDIYEGSVWFLLNDGHFDKDSDRDLFPDNPQRITADEALTFVVADDWDHDNDPGSGGCQF